jgi:antirestriction protein ArdC
MSRSHPATPRADVYSRITTEIVSAIEAGAGDWRMPWHHDGAATTRPQNVTSRRRYRGVNVLALWIAAEASCLFQRSLGDLSPMGIAWRTGPQR